MDLKLNEMVLRNKIKLSDKESREEKLQELKNYTKELCIGTIDQLQEIFPYVKLDELEREIIIKPCNTRMHDYNVYFKFGYENHISITVDRKTKYYKYYSDTTKVEIYKNVKNLVRELTLNTLSFYEYEKFGINKEIERVNRK